MFSRLDKYDGPIIRGAYIREGEGVYIRDVNWVTYLGNVYSEGGERRHINRILRYLFCMASLITFLIKAEAYAF